MKLKVGGFYLTEHGKVIGPLIEDKHGHLTAPEYHGRLYWNPDGVCVLTYHPIDTNNILQWNIKHELIIKEVETKMTKKTYIVKGPQTKWFDHLEEAEKWAREMSWQHPSYRWTIYVGEAICYYECPLPQPIRTSL